MPQTKRWSMGAYPVHSTEPGFYPYCVRYDDSFMNLSPAEQQKLLGMETEPVKGAPTIERPANAVLDAQVRRTDPPTHRRLGRLGNGPQS